MGQEAGWPPLPRHTTPARPEETPVEAGVKKISTTAEAARM